MGDILLDNIMQDIIIRLEVGLYDAILIEDDLIVLEILYELDRQHNSQKEKIIDNSF